DLLASRSALLCPKLIHARKSQRIFLFEDVPTVEVGHRGIVRKSRHVFSPYPGIDLKSDKFQLVLRGRSLDRGQHGPVFLNIEQKIPTLTDAAEVRTPGDVP